MKHSASAILFAILIGACTSRPAVEESPVPESQPIQDTRILDNVLLDISICSPRSLDSALAKLDDTDAGISDYGQELKYVAVTLYGILYPELASELLPVATPVDSFYPEFFEIIRNGSFPQVSQENVSFLTLLLPPLACLFTSDRLVLDQCMDALIQAELLDTQSVIPPYLLGILSEKRNDVLKAMEYYEKVLRLDDSCYPAGTGWVRCAMAVGRTEEAMSKLDSLNERFPDNSELMYLRSLGAFNEAMYAEALEYITDALWVMPENPSYLLLRARIYEAQGNLEQAKRILTIVEKRIPENEEMAFLKARILFRQKDLTSASVFIEDALRRYPSSSRLIGLYGEVLIASDRKDEARSYLQEILQQDPSNIRSLELLARDAMDSGEWEAAAGYIEELLSLDVKAEYLRMAAEVSIALGDRERALIFAERLYRMNPEDGTVVLLYLETLIAGGKPGGVEEIARRALAAETDSEIRSDLYFYLSRVAATKDERVGMLRSSLLENLHNLNALVSLADFYAESGDYRKAYRYINQAYLLAPEDPDIRLKLRRIEELAK